MRANLDAATNSAEDIYPSRGGRKAVMLERRDPVVYASDRTTGPITADQVKQFETDGYLVLNDVFHAEEIAAFQAESDRLRQDLSVQSRGETITEPTSGDVRSVFSIHENSAVFKALARDARLVTLAQYLLDDQVYIHQSRLNYKPGFRGKEFYWHSDFETWHVEDGMPRMRALSMSITLTENNSHNGPLMLIPGSHRKYVVCEGMTPENHFKSSLKKQEYGVPDDEHLTQLVDAGGIVEATGKPGSVILFDCNIMHGSNSNITPFPRSNVFVVYNALNNRVVAPFCDQPPRPEFVCSRQRIEPIAPLTNEGSHG